MDIKRIRNMDEIERSIRENVGSYIETPWTIIESYLDNLITSLELIIGKIQVS